MLPFASWAYFCLLGFIAGKVKKRKPMGKVLKENSGKSDWEHGWEVIPSRAQTSSTSERWSEKPAYSNYSRNVFPGNWAPLGETWPLLSFIMGVPGGSDWEKKKKEEKTVWWATEAGIERRIGKDRNKLEGQRHFAVSLKWVVPQAGRWREQMVGPMCLHEQHCNISDVVWKG